MHAPLLITNRTTHTPQAYLVIKNLQKVQKTHRCVGDMDASLVEDVDDGETAFVESGAEEEPAAAAASDSGDGDAGDAAPG